MINPQFIQKLKQVCEFDKNVALKEKTTFRIGGKVPFFIKPMNSQEFIDAVRLCQDFRIKYVIMGAGSNVLAPDANIDFVVISTLGLNKCYINRLGFLYAEAGVRLADLVRFATNNELGGLEYLIGIPGTVGGAVVMNAGAFGSEIGNFVEYIDILENGRMVRLKKENLFWGYRHSTFTNSKKYAIIGVGFWLKKGRLDVITKRMQYAILLRAKTQKVGYPSAGSVFKKSGDLAPAYLIEQCGLKGYTVGGAQVSTVHSGYIVNLGYSTCQDVLKVIHYVRNKVKENFGVTLELEIIVL